MSNSLETTAGLRQPNDPSDLLGVNCAQQGLMEFGALVTDL